MNRLRMKLVLTCLFVIAICNLTIATNYYFSNEGNDSNNGKSESRAWRTIDRLKKAKLKPGDKVLFRCGDVFRGEIKIKSSGTGKKPIIFTSYGSGQKPIISGAVKIDNWKLHKGKIFKANVTDTIKNLFANNKMQTSARFPNHGFLYVDKKMEKEEGTLYDKNLSQPDDYWKNATLRIRTSDWTTRHGEIVSHKDKTITFKEEISAFERTVDNISKGAGYYIDNKFEELDSLSEWYFDKNKMQVYFYPEEDISAYLIEGSVFQTAFTISSDISYIEISNLKIEKFLRHGVVAKGNNKSIVIQNNHFENINSTAVHFSPRAFQCKVSHNKLNNILGRGIYSIEPEGLSVIGNTITNIGLKYGYGISGLNGMIGIAIINKEEEKTEQSPIAKNNIIRGNVIRNIGYNGIRIDGINSVCEHNYVTNAMCRLNDGAGIYCWAKGANYTSNNRIVNNIVDNIQGNTTDGLKFDHNAKTVGIYLDNRTEKITVESNVVCNISGNGIFLNADSKYHIIKGNIIYSAPFGISIGDYYTPPATYGNRIEGNLVFSAKPKQYCISVTSYSQPTTDTLASFQNNRYYSLIERFVAKETVEEDEKNVMVTRLYTMKSWNERMKKDLNSQWKLYNHPFSKEHKSPFKSAEIFYNPSEASKLIQPEKDKYFELNGDKVAEEVLIAPWDAKIFLLKETEF